MEGCLSRNGVQDGGLKARSDLFTSHGSTHAPGQCREIDVASNIREGFGSTIRRASSILGTNEQTSEIEHPVSILYCPPTGSPWPARREFGGLVESEVGRVLFLLDQRRGWVGE